MSSDFILQDELYVVNGRMCRLYLPPIVLELEDDFIYWIQYLDDEDVTAVHRRDIRLANRYEKALYGRSIKRQ